MKSDKPMAKSLSHNRLKPLSGPDVVPSLTDCEIGAKSKVLLVCVLAQSQ